MLLSIFDSWQTMSFLEKFYWCFAIPFSLIFVIQIIMTFFGGDMGGMDGDGDADMSIEHDAGIEFQFITLKNLVAFFTIFGWVGIACVNGNVNTGLTILISTAAGVVMMVIMASIIYFMGQLTDDGTLDIKNAVGKTASVYLRIPARRAGKGQVQIKVQGLRTLDAITDEEEEIKTGSMVEVVGIVSDEILLVKLNNDYITK